MAAGKDQAQTIVGNLAKVVEVWCVDDWLGTEVRISFEFFLKTCLTSQAIDGFVFCSLDNPGARRVGNSVSAPLIDGGGEGILGGVFGKFEIAKLTYESCNNPTPVRSIHCVNSHIRVWKHV